MNVVYMLQCKDNTFYTGWTNRLEKRLKAHRAGKGAKYTRGRGPLTVVYVEELPTASAAMKREHEIKQYTRTQKIDLITGSVQ